MFNSISHSIVKLRRLFDQWFLRKWYVLRSLRCVCESLVGFYLALVGRKLWGRIAKMKWRNFPEKTDTHTCCWPISFYKNERIQWGKMIFNQKNQFLSKNSNLYFHLAYSSPNINTTADAMHIHNSVYIYHILQCIIWLPFIHPAIHLRSIHIQSSSFLPF